MKLTLKKILGIPKITAFGKKIHSYIFPVNEEVSPKSLNQEFGLSVEESYKIAKVLENSAYLLE